MTTRPIKVWDGTAWIDVGVYGPDTTGFALTANNLSDLASASTALSNLGGTPTTRTITAGTGLTGGGDLSANRTLSVTGLTNNEIASGAAIAASKISGTALVASNNLSEVTAATALANLGGGPAMQVTKSGRWITPTMGVISNSIMTANLAVGALYPVDTTHTLDRIGIRIVTSGSSGSVVRLGIYKADANGADYTLTLDAGTVDGTQAPGDYAITINQSLTPGLYALVAVGQGSPATQPTLRYSTTAGGLSHLMSGDSQATVTTNANGLGLSFGTISGALPSTNTPNRYGIMFLVAGRIA